jgi:hypothetical protein
MDNTMAKSSSLPKNSNSNALANLSHISTPQKIATVTPVIAQKSIAGVTTGSPTLPVSSGQKTTPFRHK